MKGLSVVKSQDLACGNCGTCCTVYGLVDLHVTDIFRISEYLGMTPKDFFDNFTFLVQDKDGNWAFSLDINGGCRFRSGDRCGIYEVRPDTCALYPFNYICFNLSATTKKEIAVYKQCFVHTLPENMLVVPNLERMIDSRIMFMVKEMYMVGFDGTFREEEARPFHEKGLALLASPKMREMIYRKMLGEISEKVPGKDETGEPVLTGEEIREICDSIRGH